MHNGHILLALLEVDIGRVLRRPAELTLCLYGDLDLFVTEAIRVQRGHFLKEESCLHF